MYILFFQTRPRHRRRRRSSASRRVAIVFVSDIPPPPPSPPPMAALKSRSFRKREKKRRLVVPSLHPKLLPVTVPPRESGCVCVCVCDPRPYDTCIVTVYGYNDPFEKEFIAPKKLPPGNTGHSERPSSVLCECAHVYPRTTVPRTRLLVLITVHREGYILTDSNPRH